MSNQLLPCPFCGGAAAYQRLRDGSKYGAYECGECGAQGPDVRTGYGPEEEWREKATAAWNERSAATQPAAGTTSDQYRAELYNEVWQRARDLGYGNVTDALVALERMKVTQPAAGEPVAIANRGEGAFWVKWTDAAEGLYGPGIKLYAAPPAAAHRDSFRTWLAAEMPAGTVIGNPAWWAERILKRIGAAAHGDEAVQYRLLRVGEVIQATDELLRDDCTTWTRMSEGRQLGIGWKWHEGLMPMRRVDAAMRAQGDGEVL